MLSRVQYWILLATAGALLSVIGIDVAVYLSNVSVQRQFSSNNQFLQQTVQRQSIYQEMTRALADLATNRNDGQLMELLTKHGFTVAQHPVASSTAGTKADSHAAAGSAAAGKPNGVH
jgi:hypothetical protein